MPADVGRREEMGRGAARRLLLKEETGACPGGRFVPPVEAGSIAAAAFSALYAQAIRGSRRRSDAERTKLAMDRTRQAAATVLAAVFMVLLPTAITVAWARQTVLSTSGYVAAVGPIGTDPAIRSAVRAAVTDEIDSVVRHAASALPAPARLLSGLLTSGLARLAGDSVGRFMASRTFRRLWINVNTSVHCQLIGVLDGSSTVLTTRNGEVVLNLGPLVNGVIKEISGRLAPLARKAISLAPGPDRRQIPLFPAAALVRARRVYRLARSGTLGLVILAPLTAALALIVAPRRRGTLSLLAIGGTAVAGGMTIAMTLLRSRLIGQEPLRWRPAITGILHSVTNGLFTLALWCVISGLVLTAVTLLTGPYPWARAIRAGVTRGARRLLAAGPAR